MVNSFFNPTTGRGVFRIRDDPLCRTKWLVPLSRTTELWDVCGRKFMRPPSWKLTVCPWKMIVERLKNPKWGVVWVSVLFFIPVFVNLRVQRHLVVLKLEIYTLFNYSSVSARLLLDSTLLHYISLYTLYSCFSSTRGGSCQLPSEYGTWM